MRFIDADELLRKLSEIYAYAGWSPNTCHFSYFDMVGNIDCLEAIVPKITAEDLMKERERMTNVNNIRPDEPTIAIENQATGEQPVDVTTDGIRPAEKHIMNIDTIRNASYENLARFLASISKCRNCLAKSELCDVSSTTCAQAWCNWLFQKSE